jgi:hypothetical protein
MARVLLIVVALVVGGIAARTVWRALGAEADYCPARGCISAFWITVPQCSLLSRSPGSQSGCYVVDDSARDAVKTT